VPQPPVETPEATSASEAIVETEKDTGPIAEDRGADFFTPSAKTKRGKKAKRSKAKALAWEDDDAFKKPEAEPGSVNVADRSPADLPEVVSVDPIELQQAESISPVQQASDQEAVSAQDVVPQDITAAPGERSGELAGVHTVDSPALAGTGAKPVPDHESKEQPASRSRDVVTAPAEKEEAAAKDEKKKGIMSSGFSMLPTISGVGSFFGLKKKQGAKEAEASPTPEAEAEEQPTVDVPPPVFSGERQQQGSGERVPDVGLLQATQEPPSHDKSLGDTRNNALVTAASTPNERVDTPEGSAENANLAGGEPLTASEAIRESELDDASGESSHKQTLQDDLTSTTTTDAADEDQVQQIIGGNIASSATDSMDWDQTTPGKKGKKGKNKRQTTKDEFVDAPAPEAPVVAEVETPAADDLWAEPAGKKGKKGKKDKKKKGADPEPFEPEPSVLEPVEVKEEPIAEDISEPVISEVPQEAAPAEVVPEEMSEDLWGVPTSKKGKKDKKKKKGTVVVEEPEPIVQETPSEGPAVEETPEPMVSDMPSEPAPAEVTEIVLEEAPEDSRGAPTSKKGKNGKKDKKSLQPPDDTVPEVLVESVAPEMVEEPEQVAESSQADQVPQQAEPVTDAAVAVPLEASADDTWAEPTAKKGKKDNKKKRQSVLDVSEVAQAETPAEVEVAEPAVESTPEIVSDPEQAEAAAEVVAEKQAAEAQLQTQEGPPQGDVRSELTATGKKGKKDKKKRKQSAGEASDASPSEPPVELTPEESIVASEEATPVEPIQVEDLPDAPQPVDTSVATELPQEEPVQEDPWGHVSTSKKGKKDKKKKKQSFSDTSPAERPAEEAAIPQEPATPVEPVQSEAVPEPSQIATAEPPTPSSEQPVEEDPWGAAPVPKKSKKDKKKKKQVSLDPEPPTETPVEESSRELPQAAETTVVEEPSEQPPMSEVEPTELSKEPQEVSAEEAPSPADSCQVDAAEGDAWPEPVTSGKKGRKNKKRKDSPPSTSWVSEIAEEPAEMKAEAEDISSEPVLSAIEEIVSSEPALSQPEDPTSYDVAPSQTEVPADSPEATTEEIHDFAAVGKNSMKDKKKKKGLKSPSVEEPLEVAEDLVSTRGMTGHPETALAAKLVSQHRISVRVGKISDWRQETEQGVSLPTDETPLAAEVVSHISIPIRVLRVI
jgi:hypothetical protein